MRGGPTTGGLARVRSPSRSTPGRVTARIDGRLRVGYLCRGGWRYRHGQAWAGLCAVLSRRLWSRRRERGRGDVGGPQPGWCTRRTAGGNRPVRRLAPCWRTREASVVCVARGRVVTMPLPSGCSAAASAHGRHPGNDATRQEAEDDIIADIAMFSNRRRQHSSLGDVNPQCVRKRCSWS